MKARWIIGFAILTVGAVAYSLRSGPPPAAEIIDRCFGYRLKDEPQIVARKSHVPLAIHGPGYEEHTTVRLSPPDYRELVGRLLADPSFEKKEKFRGTGFYHDRFIIGQEVLSWWTEDSTREFSFSYIEYSPKRPK
jgi:hypothetical protein